VAQRGLPLSTRFTVGQPFRTSLILTLLTVMREQAALGGVTVNTLLGVDHPFHCWATFWSPLIPSVSHLSASCDRSGFQARIHLSNLSRNIRKYPGITGN